MDWSVLSFLAEPWFVIPWYAVGLAGAAFVTQDVLRQNTPLKTAMKWAWPIIVLFFSVLGLWLYFATARAPGVGRLKGKEKEEAHARYEENTFRRVNGAVIHCVAGDGLGVMTGMVIARALGMSFWQEFWFEYACGFALGWLIFQLKSMRAMADNLGQALWMAFRSEFFSMLTVMAGMGAVMAYVTPLAVTQQPKPLTYAFWGFGALGLMVGYAFTFPMNTLLVKIGWKHGMGPPSESATSSPVGRRAILAMMCALGAVALGVPATLDQIRKRLDVAPLPERGLSTGTGGAGITPLARLGAGLESSVHTASEALRGGEGTQAAIALDDAFRAASVAGAAAPESALEEALRNITLARRALHQGARADAVSVLSRTEATLRGKPASPRPTAAAPDRFRGATVLDARGARIGEVATATRDRLELKIGGLRDVWGFLDLSGGQSVSASPDSLLFGPRQRVGPTWVVLP